MPPAVPQRIDGPADADKPAELPPRIRRGIKATPATLLSVSMADSHWSGSKVSSVRYHFESWPFPVALYRPNMPQHPKELYSDVGTSSNTIFAYYTGKQLTVVFEPANIRVHSACGCLTFFAGCVVSCSVGKLHPQLADQRSLLNRHYLALRQTDCLHAQQLWQEYASCGSSAD